MMRANTCILVLSISASVLYSAHSLAAGSDYKKLFPGNDQRHLSEAGKYRFEFDNDAFVDSDNGFSNGWSFQIHTPVADSWEKIQGPSTYVKTLAAWLPTLTDDNLNYRLSFAVGHVIQTPDEIENPNPIPNDVPYAGLLTGQLGLIAYNDNEFRGFGFVLGVLGRPSMAEQIQNFWHNTSGTAETAEGWDNQLETEPILNATYMRKKKFYRAGKRANFSFDASISGDIELGNLITAAGVRLETRFGMNMPGGFSYYSDPIGRLMTYDASLAPEKSTQASIYGTIGIHAAAIAHNILLDGNVFRDSPPVAGKDIEKESSVGNLAIGFHYERPTWAFHLLHVITTDVVKADSAAATGDPDNTFSTIMFEWRI
jgi:lipid A 3-O-deacylase